MHARLGRYILCLLILLMVAVWALPATPLAPLSIPPALASFMAALALIGALSWRR